MATARSYAGLSKSDLAGKSNARLQSGLGKSVSFKRPMEGRAKGGAKLKGQGFDPASGRKVFKKEFRSGFKMAKTAGLTSGRPTAALQNMKQRLSALDSGSVVGKPGERSFLRGAMRAASGGGGGG